MLPLCPFEKISLGLESGKRLGGDIQLKGTENESTIQVF
jgi:hypothetical protein